ncbi:MAG TPA: TetR/AcrR family transcriptional regulator [Variovorax sp.]|nr:TetR/AcrR family transcriptional regulator [Variovorax sp.]
MTTTDESTVVVADDHRSRLLSAMARAVAAKGFALVTIADIVAEAGVSRRTFYEHFPTKAECLIGLYERASAQGVQVLAAALDPALPWHRQVDQVLAAYLAWLAGNPVLLRTMFIDILGLGPDGLAARRRAHNALAGFILATLHAGRHTRPMDIPPHAALALVGGVHELVLDRLEAGDADGIRQLAPVAGQLARRLLTEGGT